jgi:hypothetical protein
MTTLWSQRVAAAEPQRMVTFTRIGENRNQIRLGLQTLVRYLRKQRIEFEYWGVIELHKSGLPHMHLVQHGSFVPKPLLAGACAAAGWGHSDIRVVSAGWSAARYCAKHLCHSHGRRWDGRLIRYSRKFFTEPRVSEEYKLESLGYGWRMEFGRADSVAMGYEDVGCVVEVGDLGVDWIQGETMIGKDVAVKYARDDKKGYLRESAGYISRWDLEEAETITNSVKLAKQGVKRYE